MNHFITRFLAVFISISLILDRRPPHLLHQTTPLEFDRQALALVQTHSDQIIKQPFVKERARESRWAATSEDLIPKGSPLINGVGRHARWLVPVASVLAPATLFWIARGSSVERKLEHERYFQSELQAAGEFPTSIFVGGEKYAVKFAVGWRDAQGVADAYVATEYRNWRALSITEQHQLLSRLELRRGQNLSSENLAIGANRGYRNFVWEVLERNPWSLVLEDARGRIAAFVWVALTALDPENVPYMTWDEMSWRHLRDADKMRTLLSDFWFTGRDRETRLAIIRLSMTLTRALAHKEAWGIRLSPYVLPFSNPRALHAHPDMTVIEYLLKVVDTMIDPNLDHPLNDPAISFHLRNAGKIIGLFQDAFPEIDYPGRPNNLHPYQRRIGGGYAVPLLCDVNASPIVPGQAAPSLLASREFLLGLKSAVVRQAVSVSDREMLAAALLTRSG